MSSGGRNTRFRSALCSVLIVLCATLGSAQTPRVDPEGEARKFKVQVWGYIGAEFTIRVQGYFDLRTRLERDLTPLSVTDDPAEIRRTAHALARQIRMARAAAKQGDIFTPTIGDEFRKALLVEIDSSAWTSIMEDNPGQLATRINASYPEGKPFASMPPNVLAVLPRLPEGIEYRFLGRDLILLDTRANVIVDRIPDAIHFNRCAKSP